MTESEKQPTVDKSTATARAFVGRLAAYESGFVSDADKSPLRNPEGAFLKRYEISNLFREAVVEETGITNQTIVWHLYNYYLEPKIAELSRARGEAAKNKNKESAEAREIAGEALVEEMKALMDNPSQYGIDPEKQGLSRAELQYVNTEDEPDEYATLDALLADVENVPDPFHVNGMLPTPEIIADACKRLYEQWYPENNGDAHTARVLIKELCIDQVIRELKRVEQNRTKEKLNHLDKLKEIDAIIQKLTILMRQIAQPVYMVHYTDMIAVGPYQSEVTFPDDLLRLPTFTNRPPYNESGRLKEGEKKANLQVLFYREVYKNVSQEDQEIALREFENGQTSFFHDTVGPISSANAYAKIEMLFKLKGFTDEQIQNSCASYISDIVEEIATFDKAYSALHRKRESVADHAELVALNTEIAEMKNNGRGQLRKKFLSKAAEIIQNKELIDVMPIESDQDNLTRLTSAETDITNEETSVFYFDYNSLSDRDMRLDEGERFSGEVNMLLQPSLLSLGANIATQDAVYVSLRDSYAEQTKKLHEFLSAQDVPERSGVESSVQKIKEAVEGMIAKIEAVTMISEESIA